MDTPQIGSLRNSNGDEGSQYGNSC
jgi:hypothetical protein